MIPSARFDRRDERFPPARQQLTALGQRGEHRQILVRAEARFREATSLRLNTEAESMLAGTRQGTSLRAYQEMIAARRLAQTRNDGPLFDTLVRTINLIKIVDTEAPVFTVAFSPNGTRIASTGDDGIRLWDAATGQPIGQPMTESTG